MKIEGKAEAGIDEVVLQQFPGELAGLTPVPSRFVAAPRLVESPVNLECRMTEIVQLRNHRREPAQAWLVMGVRIASNSLQDGIFDTFGAGIVLRADGPAACATIEPGLRFDMLRRPLNDMASLVRLSCAARQRRPPLQSLRSWCQ